MAGRFDDVNLMAAPIKSIGVNWFSCIAVIHMIIMNKMSQHSVQKAYLKNFCVNGKLWAYDIKTKIASSKPASQCTTEDNFQPERLEIFQNRVFESPGIKSLRKLLDSKNINETEYSQIKYWSALHLIRSKKYRDTICAKYEFDFNM